MHASTATLTSGFFPQHVVISESRHDLSGCLLSIECTVYTFDQKTTAIVPASPDAANILFQIDGKDASFAEKAFSTALSPGTLVELVNKSAGFHGAVWRAAPGEAVGTFGVQAETGITGSHIGVSVIVSSNNYIGEARESIFLTATPVGPFEYPALYLGVPVSGSVTYAVKAPLGFNPLASFDHPISSEACLNGATVFPVTSTVTVTTSSTSTTTTTVISTSTTPRSTRAIAVQEQDVFKAVTATTTTKPPTTTPTTTPLVETTPTTTAEFGLQFAASSASMSASSGSIGGAVLGGIAVLLLAVAIFIHMRKEEQLDSIIADPEAFEAATEMLRSASISANNIQETNLDNETYDEPVMFEGSNRDFTNAVASSGDAEVSDSEESEESDSEESTEVELSALVTLPPSVAATLSLRGCTLQPDCPCIECKQARSSVRLADQVHERRRDRADALASQIQQLAGITDADAAACCPLVSALAMASSPGCNKGSVAFRRRVVNLVLKATSAATPCK